MHVLVLSFEEVHKPSQDYITSIIIISSSSPSPPSSSSFWHYSLWSLVYSKIVLHCSWSCRLHLQLLMPMFIISPSTDSSTLKLGFPICQVPSGLKKISLLQRYSSCILQRCPSHLNLPIFNTLTTSSSSKGTMNTTLS